MCFHQEIALFPCERDFFVLKCRSKPQKRHYDPHLIRPIAPFCLFMPRFSLPARCPVPHLHVETVAAPLPEAALKSLCQNVAEALHSTLCPVPLPRRSWAASVRFDSDAEVQLLNATYRHKDKPTDVLSFPTADAERSEPGEPHDYLGDVILAHPYCANAAQTLDVPLPHHLCHLVVHGLLHLMGYDHLTEADALIMEQAETSILAKLNIPSPYAPSLPRTLNDLQK